MSHSLEDLLRKTKREGDCLIWTGCLNTDGYPRANVNGNSNTKVHRLVYKLSTGKNIDGLVVRHSCDNPRCINPTHLLSGTPKDNMLDRDSRGRHGAAKLSHKDVREVRNLYAAKGYSQKDLAKMFGVNPRTISSLVNFNHFKHVSAEEK